MGSYSDSQGRKKVNSCKLVNKLSIGSPRPFTNWGDWLIWRSTALGGFLMGTCISIIRAERYSGGWVQQMTEEDIRRVLARYKEHVTYWNTRYDIVQKELFEFAEALQWNFGMIRSIFESVPAKRYPPLRS